jgi:two-component sensor histidine kinase
MIFLTWAAIWIVTERQLTRWIIYLKRVSAAYRSGHYAFRPQLEEAPSELKLLGDSMSEMAGAISDRDRSLREAVAQKSLLIKEIHHRVKNNLQVVMSLLSLQANRLKDYAAQEALRDTRARINALALVHRILYEIDDENTVDVQKLLEQLAEQTSEGFGAEGRDIEVTTDIVHRSIPSETAIILSLFAVEAMTNAFKHAFPDDRGGRVRVVLKEVGSCKLRLSIEDNGVGYREAGSPSSIGSRLIRTFGQQIGGKAEIRSPDGKGTIVEIVFPDPAAPKGQAVYREAS